MYGSVWFLVLHIPTISLPDSASLPSSSLLSHSPNFPFTALTHCLPVPCGLGHCKEQEQKKNKNKANSSPPEKHGPAHIVPYLFACQATFERSLTISSSTSAQQCCFTTLLHKTDYSLFSSVTRPLLEYFRKFTKGIGIVTTGIFGVFANLRIE